MIEGRYRVAMTRKGRAAREVGRGKRPASELDHGAARQARHDRALSEPLDVRPRFDLPFPSLEVRNPEHQTHYRVLLPGYPEPEGGLCPCPDFGRRGVGTCKHLEAAWMYLSDHPIPSPAVTIREPPMVDAWATIERRLKEQSGPGLDPRSRVRAASRLLFEVRSG